MAKKFETTQKGLVKGIILENRMEKRTTKAGKEMIGGHLIIGVDPTGLPIQFDEENVAILNENLIEVKASVFVYKMTKAGAVNKTYDSYEKALGYRAFNIVGLEADFIQASLSISENNFLGGNGDVVSYTEIQASFIEKCGNDCTTCELTVDTYFKGIRPEFNKDQIETGSFIVESIIVNWKGANLIQSVIKSPQAIQYFKTQVQEGNQIMHIMIPFRKTEVFEETLDTGFGDPVIQKKTQTTSYIESVSATKPKIVPADLLKTIQGLMKERDKKLENIKNKTNQLGSGANAANAANTPAGNNGFNF